MTETGYGPICGHLHQYDRSLSLMISPPHASHPKVALIHLGGLSDGYLPTPYTLPLCELCHKNNMSYVNVLLSSSYLGFGYASLETDCEELKKALRYLQEQSYRKVYLIGHSTGCQQTVVLLRELLTNADEITMSVGGAILQAPVSDRESFSLGREEGDHAKYTTIAAEMISSGKGEEFMPRASHWSPITAGRFMSLYGRGGDDDMFSSDLEEAELSRALSHLAQFPNVIFAHSGADEYVPPEIEMKSLHRKLEVASGCKFVVIDGGKHNLAGDGSAMREFLDVVDKMID